MASFVREVLLASGRLGEKEDFSGKAHRLKDQVDDMKLNLCSRIESKYVDFVESLDEVSTAVVRLETVNREIETLQHSVNTHLKAGLVEADSEATEIIRQLKELCFAVKITNIVKKAYEDIEEAGEYLERKDYLEATDKLAAVDSVTKNINWQGDEDAKRAMEAIKKESISLQQKIAYVLGKDWDENVKIVPVLGGDEELQSVTLDLKSRDKLQNLIQAMHLIEALAYKQQKFCQNLIKYIFEPLITRVSKLEPVGNSIVFHFGKRHEGGGLSNDFAITVMDNVETACLFLANSFDFPLNRYEGKPLFVSSLGEQFTGQMISLLLKNCLQPSVPDEKCNLNDFGSVICSVKSFNEALINANLMKESDEHAKILDSFSSNINSAFINKRCVSLLVKARKLMKLDLHVSTQITEKPSLGAADAEEMMKTVTNTDIVVDMDLEEEMLPLPMGMSLNDGLFKFPSCQVSSSVIQIAELVQEVIDEAVASTGDVNYCGRLLVTARNIFEMYNDILPISHSESLKSFPLNCALAYNNCMYLAHSCLQIYIPSDQLPAPLTSRPLTLADLVPRLRQTGVEVFLGQMRRLREQFRSMLRDSVTGFGQLDGSNMLPSTSDKCIKQIMHQLMHLRSLWQTALPLSIYRRAIGTIINTIAEELVQKVVVLEDIAADVAVKICVLYTQLQERAPEVFLVDGKSKETSKGDIIRYVKKWNRFKELIVVLNASLSEIEDRWASGKGPLAIEYSPDEVKRLIRALFQNTDRRAGVLSRIK